MTTVVAVAADATTEPLLVKDNSRLVLFPIQDQQLYSMYEKARDSVWFTAEVDTSEDLPAWDVLTDEERHFLSMILAFFANSDGIVMENLAVRFLTEVGLAEARMFYSVQIFIEAIHSEMYSILIDTYIRDPVVREKHFRAVDHFPCVANKVKWAEKWIVDQQSSFGKRVAAFAIVEGVFFSGAFASIFWMKKRGIKMPGLFFSNELISKDEGLHAEFAAMIYNRVTTQRMPVEEMYEMMREAVSVETEFICEAIPCRMIGMNSDLMMQYIYFVADRVLCQLGYEALYKVTNPFDFMELISLQSKVNFFEKMNPEYSIASKPEYDEVFTSHHDDVDF